MANLRDLSGQAIATRGAPLPRGLTSANTRRPPAAPLLALACLGLAFPRIARAQTDEIQVYDATIEDPGDANLTLHNNYTPSGRTAPSFPGGLTPNHTENGVFEWAIGLKPWWELALYVPLYSFTGDGKILYNGFKLRSLFVSPHARDRRFFYGLNFEFSVNSPHWDPSHFSGEIRPIAGVHLGPWDLIANPILDTAFNGLHALDFAPAERVAYNVSTTWALAAEAYGDYGMVTGFAPIGRAAQTLFGVVDYYGAPLNVEFGVGHGFSGPTDHVVLKLILEKQF
jgi:hypothetical protein